MYTCNAEKVCAYHTGSEREREFAIHIFELNLQSRTNNLILQSIFKILKAVALNRIFSLAIILCNYQIRPHGCIDKKGTNFIASLNQIKRRGFFCLNYCISERKLNMNCSTTFEQVQVVVGFACNIIPIEE